MPTLKMLRYDDGFWPNLWALLYVLTGYAAGWWLFFTDSILLYPLGVLLVAHSMVIAAYLLHECAHGTIFKDNDWNANLGRVLMWFTGACYGTYEEIRHKHFRHHVDKADVVAFDYRPRLARYPALVKVMQLLEWLYIPALEIMMHLLVIVLPFTMDNRRHKRKHVLTVLAIRAVIFTTIFYIQPVAILLYVVAYLLFLTVMRFMDVHQHTYEIFETLDEPRDARAKQFDRVYEQRNTFSNLISRRYPWLNLLVLNFGYHNAHHKKPTIPWYRLPDLHHQLYGDDQQQMFPFINLLKSYHQYRVPRMLNADEGDIEGLEKGRRFIGVDGVSFLTAH
ncbi:fatty acid desaturase family protein [Kaarinaea lacus]